MNDLIAGRVQFYASPTLGVLPQYRAGKLRLLAVTSAERLAAAPEIPTVSEKGLPFVLYGWLGICAGSGTPRPIIAKLNREIVDIVASPAYRDMIEKAGSVPVSSTPEELRKVLEETYEQTERVAREFDLKVD